MIVPGRRTLAPAAAAAIALIMGGRATGQDAASVLHRAERAYDAASTFRATFVQTIVNPMLGTPEVSRGVVFLEPPDLFAMRFTDPPGDRVVADGTWLWIYAPSSVPDQVLRQPIPSAGTATPNLVTQFVDRPLERYRATLMDPDRVGSVVVDVVRLEPKVDGLPFRRAEIAIARNDGLLRRIALMERSGQRRMIEFPEIETNRKIDPAEFRFEVPRGARVVVP